VLVHDMSYADRRESLARRVTLGSVVLLALAAAAAIALGGQVAWRRWTAEMRRQIRGGVRRREFQPLLRDIHDLAGRLAVEAAEERGGLWGPERLTQALRRHLHGEKVVLIANREPYIHERVGGEVKVLRPRWSRSCRPAPASGSPTAAGRPTARCPTRGAGSRCPPARARIGCGACG
jgi:trehalose 6-phosphate synthase